MSSNPEFGGALAVPVTTLQYRDMSSRSPRDAKTQGDSDFLGSEISSANQEGISVSEPQLAARIEQERAAAAIETEQKLRKEFEQKLNAARAQVASLLSSFETEKCHYYASVESEIVQLALAIAAKILHREAQVDPMLLAALVRLAVEKMRDGSTVNLRVSPGRGESWKKYFASVPGNIRVTVTEDGQLNDQDCVMETEIGSANFGLDTQLKEVEQGFFDLLALRPGNR
jgi:flagellar assembly protein FliH